MNDPLEHGYEVVDEASAEKTGETIASQVQRRLAELSSTSWTVTTCKSSECGDVEIHYYRRKAKVQA